jgi:hypothetical protein
MTGTKRGKPTLAEITPRERWHLELAIHEGAHAVAGVVLGAQLRNAVVINSRVTGVEGRTNFADRPHGRDPELAYCGPYAQAKFRAGGGRPTQRQVLAVLKAGGYKDDRVLIAAGGTHLGLSVVPLLERCWPAVVRVAQQLHRAGEVTEADVLAALGVDDGGGRTSVQLASIRSGCRAVPPITTKKQAVPA